MVLVQKRLQNTAMKGWVQVRIVMFSVSVFSNQNEIVPHFVRRSLTENEHSCRIWEGTRFHRQRNPCVTIRVNTGKVNNRDNYMEKTKKQN